MDRQPTILPDPVLTSPHGYCQISSLSGCSLPDCSPLVVKHDPLVIWKKTSALKPDALLQLTSCICQKTYTAHVSPLDKSAKSDGVGVYIYSVLVDECR